MGTSKMFLYIGIFIFGFAAISLWNFYSVIRPSKIDISLSPSDFGLAEEVVSIKSSDGLNLSAWLFENIETKKKKRAIIILHGYPADKRDMLSFAAHLHRNFTVLVPDLRSFGESEGAYTTLGIKERGDVSSVIDFLESRGYEEVGILGFSLGGAGGFLSAAEDYRIKAIASYASFSDLPALGEDVYSKLFIFKKPMVNLMLLWSRLFFHESVRDVSPVLAAQKISIPILIIHPKQDEQIPFAHAMRLKEALKDNQNAQFIFHEGRHGDLPEDIYERLRVFFQ